MDASGGTPPYFFAPDGQTFQGLAQIQDVQPGTYAFPFQDANGCEAVESVLVLEPEPLQLNLPSTTPINLGDSLEVMITDNAAVPLNYQWTPEASVRCPTCASTSVRPFTTTLYTIRASDEDGCTVQAQWLVSVQRIRDIFVPDAFSPNDDGYNDFFAVFTGKSVEQVADFRVFDRWGNLIFEAEDCAEACQWDGTFRGEDVESGVYVYVAEILYLDDFRETVTGDVLLIR